MSVPLAAADPKSAGDRKGPGKLVVVGSGIKAIGHFTLETQAHIQQADIVLYSVADPVTELWIQEQNPNHFDLYEYYGNGKNRNITYSQMVERMLDEVRAGKYVVAVFYGHPGVFVTPSHNAIHLARKEGYEARMLAAVSAEDCLFADLGIDPSVPGLQTYEATDLLLLGRTLCPDVNVIIWQVGCVGDVGFDFAGYQNQHFGVLIDLLESVYGPEHELANYVAPIFATGEPEISWHRIGDFRDPQVAGTVSGISTFFIPAKEPGRPQHEIAAAFGLQLTAPQEPAPLISELPIYPELREISRAANANHSVPHGYRYSSARESLYRYLRDLTLDPRKLADYRRDPGVYINTIPGLSPYERQILQMNHPGALRQLYKTEPGYQAQRFIRDAMHDAALGAQYRDVVARELQALHGGQIDRTGYETRIAAWLRSRGYLTTATFVTEAQMTTGTTSSTSSTGTYLTSLKTGSTYVQGPIIVINGNQVTVDGVQIQGAAVSSSMAMWMASSGNPSNAMLGFFSSGGISYLQGSYWLADESQPADNNLFGSTTPTPAVPLSNWDGTYTTYTCADPTDSNPTWTQDSTMVVSGGNSVTYRDTTIQNWTYLDETASGGSDVNELSWFTSGSNQDNVAVSFSTQDGNQVFFGQRWDSGTRPTAVNFSGTTASNPPSNAVSVAMLMMMSSSTSATTSNSSTTSSSSTSSTTSSTTTTTTTTTTLLAEAGEVPAESSEPHPSPEAQLSAAEALAERGRAMGPIIGQAQVPSQE